MRGTETLDALLLRQVRGGPWKSMRSVWAQLRGFRPALPVCTGGATAGEAMKAKSSESPPFKLGLLRSRIEAHRRSWSRAGWRPPRRRSGSRLFWLAARANPSSPCSGCLPALPASFLAGKAGTRPASGFLMKKAVQEDVWTQMNMHALFWSRSAQAPLCLPCSRTWRGYAGRSPVLAWKARLPVLGRRGSRRHSTMPGRPSPVCFPVVTATSSPSNRRRGTLGTPCAQPAGAGTSSTR